MTDADLIAKHIAAKGVTVCPPMTHARPEWEGGPMNWREMNNASWQNATRKKVAANRRKNVENQKRQAKERRDEFVRMHKAGVSAQDIARRFHVTVACVQRHIREAIL